MVTISTSQVAANFSTRFLQNRHYGMGKRTHPKDHYTARHPLFAQLNGWETFASERMNLELIVGRIDFKYKIHRQQSHESSQEEHQQSNDFVEP